MYWAMPNFATCAVLLACICCNYAWNYDHSSGSHEGPFYWGLEYPDCDGDHQSPIDISHSVYDPNLKYFDFSNYANTEGVTMKLENMDGHTVEVALSGPPMYVEGGSLPGHYRLAQFHFHWGFRDGMGSEHLVDGRGYSMEMHLVHMREDVHVANDPNGLAVIAFLFKVKNVYNHPDAGHNAAFDVLMDHLQAVQAPDSEVSIEHLTISNLLPDIPEIDYFRYHGSLTTPPCTEDVVWSVAQTLITVSSRQLDRFRSLHNKAGRSLENNFRPIQPLNGRNITSTSEYPHMH